MKQEKIKGEKPLARDEYYKLDKKEAPDLRSGAF